MGYNKSVVWLPNTGMGVLIRDTIILQCLSLVLGKPGLPWARESVGNFLNSIEYSQYFAVENVGGDEYCFSKDCIQSSAQLLSNMDQTADPCQDFFQFACGGYVKNTPIADDRTSTSLFSDIRDKLNIQLRGLLEEKLVPEDPRPVRLVKNLYQSCMDKDLIEQKGVGPMLRVLQNLGGWPVLERGNWVNTGFKWFNTAYRMREEGYSVDYLVDLSVTTDVKNSSYRVLDLDQPGLGLSREYLVKGVEDEDIQAYLTYMTDMAVLLGADEEEAKEQMLETLLFEIKLAEISVPREERRNKSLLYNPMPISQLSELDPHTPWLEYINTVLSQDIVTVDDSETVIVGSPSYIRDLSKVLVATPARVQANYLMWRVVRASVSYLSSEARQIGLQFSRKLSGKSELPPRWSECVGKTTSSLSVAVGSLYVRNYFDEDSRKIALELVEEIRKEFLNIVDENDWMDKETKGKAVAKANSIVAHIGYPEEILDMKKLDELYSGLEIFESDYFGNGNRIRKFGTNYSFSKLRQRVDKNDWVRHGQPAVVNAFYNSVENAISFPAGILQGGFFNKGRPYYMNYAAIGWVVGHEITHGFDDQGRQFDKDGNLIDWWKPETHSRYVEKASCIIDQYSNYSINNLNLRGINNQGENIADNGGIKEAYNAYKTRASQHGPGPLLPGLPYTQSQLFWLSAANVWCVKYRPEGLKSKILTGAHSPSMFRVRGTFSNMEHFSRDFNCPVGTPMNPGREKQCHVW